ncbi:hypothetical protein HYDPIDRAFT_138023 [Hydnomerulius pinastri MD-312]|uniref:Ribonucleases P/MRP subunit Pop8-like domain-containing protein n=1 Tax=Hydnomerulius pinastri MD-312 TaxID=994086 RepID=A0A0C9WBI0_9AGAM|nr:hypothetical protein HYDPIDRAFT_138023 [Hydnomerulius pinastri MD-312]
MTFNPLPSIHHYICLGVEPCCTDALLIRKSLQDILTELFGLTVSSTYIDILSVNEQGSEIVIRVNPEDAPKILAAVAGASGAPIKFSVVKESPFLPSLLSRDFTTRQ